MLAIPNTAMKHPKHIHEKLKTLPDEPGVYIMRDRRGKVIYIGKAASLRNRVRNYFQDATFRKAEPKIRGLIRAISDFDYLVTRTEAQAAITESQFIKDYKPRYNTMLKDDKRFILLKVDVQHPFPQVTTCRLKKDDGALYFGPYANSTAARAAQEFVERRFGLRQCSPLRPGEEQYRHCLNDIIRYCSAPCIEKVSMEQYRAAVEEACAFLRGERPAYLREIREAMQTESTAKNFEKAAALRDTLLMLQRAMKERAKVRKSEDIRRQEAWQGLYELQQALDLPALPRVIETFDISNISGTYAVASMVVSVDGVPDRKRYRQFRIKTVEGPDDPGMMAETIQRRYRRVIDEKQDLPGLVLVDGGITQVRAARKELDLLGLSQLRVAGLAKRYEEIYTDTVAEPLLLPRESSALKVLQQIRDEAHRFAITYHRTLRAKRIRESELDDIPGIGSKRKQVLLQHFGSVTRLKCATVEEIMNVPGFGPDGARMLHEALACKLPPSG
jgi:excinuclease ABC subunit C